MNAASLTLDVFSAGDRLKRCPTCGLWLPRSRFGRNRGRSDLLAVYCKACGRRHQQEIRPRSLSAWTRNKRKYITGVDISQDDWLDVLISQGHRCAVCKEANPGGSGSWHTDHDHTTGRFRGLPCQRCNTNVVPSAESPFLLAALRYIGRTDIQPIGEGSLPVPTQGVST